MRSRNPDTARTGFSRIVNRPLFTWTVTSQNRIVKRRSMTMLFLFFAINPFIPQAVPALHHDLFQDMFIVEDLARSERHASERVLSDNDRKRSLLAQKYIHSLEQC